MVNTPPARVAIIGVSGYGSIHLQLARASQQRGEITLSAATIINPDEETATVSELRAGGTEIFNNYEEMLRRHAGRIDLCLIPTGIHWHARMTIAALKAGANVLVEKPLAGSLAEVEEIRRVERAAGRFVAVGFQDIYEPGTIWLRDELRRGVIGKVESVRFLGVWPRPREYFTRNDWAGRLQVDGAIVLDSPLNNAFAHFVMLSLFFIGADLGDLGVRVDGAELLRAHEIESFDTAVIRSHTASGVKLWFGASHACAETIEPEIVITGSHGQAHWRYESETDWRSKDGAKGTRKLPDISVAREEMFEAALRRLQDPHAPICTSELAAQHTALIEMIPQQGPIETVSPERVTWVGEKGKSSQVAQIHGLTEALRRSYAAEQSLAASGFPKLKPSCI